MSLLKHSVLTLPRSAMLSVVHIVGGLWKKWNRLVVLMVNAASLPLISKSLGLTHCSQLIDITMHFYRVFNN